MRAMKDSGVEWLGEVPEGWGVAPLNREFQIVLGATPASSDPSYWDESGDGIAWVTPADFETGSDVRRGRRSITESGYESCGTTLVPEGSIVISTRAPIGKVGYAAAPLCTNQGCKVLVRKTRGAASRFYFYVMQAADEELALWGRGTTFAELPGNALAGIRVPLPPIDEQRRIADYLDERCAQIDRAIASAEQSVEEYVAYEKQLITDTVEGLDSDRRRLRHLCTRIFDGPFGSHLKSADYIDDGVRVVRLENLKYMRFDDSKQSFVSPEKYETIARHTVLPGDLIMATFVAKEVQVASLPEGIQYAVNKADCVGLRLKDELCYMRFIQYALSSNRVFHFLRSNLHGTTRDRVNTSQIKEISVPLPPLPEQRRIADYLDEKCAQIDQAVEAKQAIIEELKAYKKSLIYEVVTGKREV